MERGLALKDDKCHGLIGRMGQRKMRSPAAQTGGELSCLSGQAQRGTATRLTDHFHILPGDPVPKAGSDSFHGCLFGCETGRQSFCRIGARKTIARLLWGEYPREEALPKALDGGLDPGHLSYVNPCAYNHLARFTLPQPMVERAGVQTIS